ncbi:MAG: hypothetical protein JZU64_12635 [Rhodoferax sp.]|jgi:hypothetical protein|nr:hypothetical protein [Rhodoferax sp.]
MKPFALSLSKGLSTETVLRQAQHERVCFTLTLIRTAQSIINRPDRRFGVGPCRNIDNIQPTGR